MALSTIASIITVLASLRSLSGRAALASISSVRSAWSSEPQLTPMRTGLPNSMARSTIAAKFASWRLAPTLPGLMRYLASARAQSSYLWRRMWPL
jgi:hypothetical protein